VQAAQSPSHYFHMKAAISAAARHEAFVARWGWVIFT
jgi:hypothetical protein